MSRVLEGEERALPARLVASAPALRPPRLGASSFPPAWPVTGVSESLPGREASAQLPCPRPQGREPLLRRHLLCVLVFASHTRREASTEPLVSEGQT